MINLINAYEPHKINTDLNFTITSNNATSCSVKTIDTPASLRIINLNMTRNVTLFYINIEKTNFTELGNICFDIECFDGISYETGSKCFEVTPSGNNGTNNIIFIIFIILIIYAIAFAGFFLKNEIIALFGGMFMMALSIYIINNGIIIYRDWITNYFSYVTLGIGVFFCVLAGMSLYEEL